MAGPQATAAHLRQELKLLYTQCQGVEHELKTSALIGQQLLQHNQVLRAKVQTAVERGLATPPISPIFELPSGDSFAEQLRYAEESAAASDTCGSPGAEGFTTEGAFDGLDDAQATGLAERVYRLQECLAEVVDDWSKWEVGVSEELNHHNKEAESKSKTASQLQETLDENEGCIQELQDRVSKLEGELEDEQECNGQLREQVEKLEHQNRQTQHKAQGELTMRRKSQTELLGVVEDADAAHSKLESDMIQLKARLACEEDQCKQLHTRITELEEKLGESMADGARYHCQLLQTRQSLFDSQEQVQELQEKQSIDKGQQMSDAVSTIEGASLGATLHPFDQTGSVPDASSSPVASLHTAISAEEVEAQDDRIDELQTQLQETTVQLEGTESKCAQMEQQHVEAENLIKDLQARLRAQGAAHVADLEYLADAEARASALVTAAADALKAKDVELNHLRARLAARRASSSSTSSVSSTGDAQPRATGQAKPHARGSGYRVEPGQSGPVRPKSKASAASLAAKAAKSDEQIWI